MLEDEALCWVTKDSRIWLSHNPQLQGYYYFTKMYTSTIRLVHDIAQMCECQVFFSLISQMVCESICTHLVYNLLPPFKPKIIANISLLVSTKYFKSFFLREIQILLQNLLCQYPLE